MFKSKLISTIKLFNRQEINRLNDFLESPFFLSERERKKIFPLFHHIMAHVGNWQHQHLSKAHTASILFIGEKNAQGKLEKLMSKLQGYVQQFIALEFTEYKDTFIEDSITTINFFRHHGKFNTIPYQLSKAKKHHASQTIKDKQYYFNAFLLNNEFFQESSLKSSTKESFSFSMVQQPLDVYYLLQKLEFACVLLSFNRFRKPLNVDHVIKFLDAVKPIYELNGTLEVPQIKIYYHIFETLRKEENFEEDYHVLKALIDEHSPSISTKTLSILRGLLRNFIISQYNHGAVHLFTELFEIQKNDLEQGFLTTDNGLLPSTFKNIVAMGLKAKEFEWVHAFLNQYQYKIVGADNPLDVFNYNKACYYFEQQMYEDSLLLLADQYVDIFYKIAAKRLELKIYYETKSEILDSKIDAFKIYIYRLSDKSILPHKREGNNNFINFLRQLRNPKSAFSKTRIRKLETKVKECKFIPEQEWLLEKITSNY